MNIKSSSIITVRFKYFPSHHVHHLQHVSHVQLSASPCLSTASKSQISLKKALHHSHSQQQLLNTTL